MATSAVTLAVTLKRRASVQASEDITDDDLAVLLTEALTEHDPDLTFTTLPTNQEYCVILLGWIKVCYVRAGKTSNDNNLSGAAGFGQDRNTPYYKAIDLAKQLRKEYESLCATLSIDPNPAAPSITVSTLRVLNTRYLGVAPLSEAPVPPAPVLSVTEDAGAEAVLAWTFTDFDDFNAFILYTVSGTNPIYQAWNFNSVTGTPLVSDAAEQIGRYSVEDLRGLKLTEIDRTQITRLLLVVQSASGRYNYSNELTLPVV